MKKKLPIILVLPTILLCFLLTSCRSDRPLVYSNPSYFGAALRAVIYCKKDIFSTFAENADILLDNLDKSFNEQHENSDIGRFNASVDGEKIPVGEETYNLILRVKETYTLTGGAFNPCVWYLTDLWGFSSRFSTSAKAETPYDREYSGEYLPLPGQKYVEAFKTLADFDKVLCYEEEGSFYLEKQNTLVTVEGVDYYAKLDLGGLIKGYATEKLALLASSLGIGRGYISYGTSSVVALENSKGKEFDLTLTNPRRSENAPDSFLRTSIKDISVSSSGDYERYYEIDGVRYCHIIDANSGAPVNNGIIAATVICADATFADMLSTALIVMGKEKALEFMASKFVSENGVKIVFALNAGEKYEVYTNMAEDIAITDDRFSLAA